MQIDLHTDKKIVVSSFIPFPNVTWWGLVQGADKVCLDLAEHFEKMTYRNKYFISGANGGIQLSIPLAKGREQRTAMQDVLIDNKQRWQTQHWRTIVSVYKRSPFFDHYEPSLQVLFETRFDRLADFNLASIKWQQQQLKCNFEQELVHEYIKSYSDAIVDLRNGFKPGIEQKPLDIEPYYQAFGDKNGFLPNLSMLDLLFAEGPHAMHWVTRNKELVGSWMTTK